MVFVVRLFTPAAMTDDGIAQTNRALTKDRPTTSFDPIGCAAESEINKIVTMGALPGVDLAQIEIPSGALVS